MARFDAYQEVTDRIIAALEAGTPPWVRPWTGNVATDWPHNGSTGRRYNGINVWILSSAGFTDSRWMTFNQARDLGGCVRKGEKGTQVCFWRIVEKEVDGKLQKAPFLRLYTVFNVAQIDGLTLDALAAGEPIETSARVAEVLDVLEANGCAVRHGGDRAYYAPGSDEIRLPEPAVFVDAGAYAATALHEAVHATGAARRLDRTFGKRFGDDAYAVEELVAELGSAYLCAYAAVEGRLQHPSYLAHWLKVLRADKYAIFTASKQAEAAAEWLLSRTAGAEAVDGAGGEAGSGGGEVASAAA